MFAACLYVSGGRNIDEFATKAAKRDKYHVLCCLIKIFLKRSFFFFCPFQACVALYVTGRSGWMVVVCTACLLLRRERGRRKGEGALLLLARSLALSLPPPSLLGATAAGSLACAPPPLPSLPPCPLPVCLAFSLRRPHLPPFLLCTCVSAPGVCGRSRVDGQPRDDAGAAITPVKVCG